MKTIKVHRKYPKFDWNFKAISTFLNDSGKEREIYYVELENNGSHSKCVEIYSGSNYIVGSKEPSYSRRYEIDNIPSKYKEIVNALIDIHKNTEWSEEDYVNQN